jgi:GNAT superfamily N-acetyltransferase
MTAMRINPASWIVGLMRENTDALGFIPAPTVAARYVDGERYVLQSDERGHPVGYVLHGVIQTGRSLSIAQHCIQYESRLRGYGEAALRALRERAERYGASAITARCAVDLAALDFWIAQGFQVRAIVPGGARRNRQIACLWLPLALPLERIDGGQQ